MRTVWGSLGMIVAISIYILVPFYLNTPFICAILIIIGTIINILSVYILFIYNQKKKITPLKFVYAISFIIIPITKTISRIYTIPTSRIVPLCIMLLLIFFIVYWKKYEKDITR